MTEADLNNALKVALSSPIEEIVTHAEVISEQLKAIKDLGSLSNGGKELFDEIRAVSLRVGLLVISSTVSNYCLTTVVLNLQV